MSSRYFCNYTMLDACKYLLAHVTACLLRIPDTICFFTGAPELHNVAK